MKKLSYFLFFLFFAAIIYSCGSGGGGAATGNVSLYVTDDLSGYEQVAAVLNSVSLVGSGSGAECFLLNSPEGVDIANLSEKILLLDVASCPAGEYNRIHIVFNNTATLTDGVQTQTCAFKSYKDNSNHPNVLNCSGISNTCTLDVNGAVNVFGGKNGKAGLDFDLKNFEVANFPNPNCTVTMKVSPLNASDIGSKKEQGYLEAITGDISNLNTTSKTFVITKGSAAFNVNYSGINNQPGIDQLLQFAVSNHLKVRLVAASIDLNSTLIPSEISVKAEGSISGLNTSAQTFTLMMPLGNIGVNYSSAVVEGTLTDGVSAEANLTGLNGGMYIASKVEAGQVETDD